MGTVNQYAINLLAQGIGRFFTFGVNFIVFVLIARIGGADFFGKYSYVTTFLGLFMLLADFGMTSVLGRDIAQVRDSAESYWGNFLMLRGLVNAVFVICSIIAAYCLRRDLFLILFIGSLSLPFLSARFFEPVFQVFRRPWYSMWSSISYGLSFMLFIVITLFCLPLNLTPVVMSFILANIVFAVFTYHLTQQIIRPTFVADKATMRQIVRLAFPLGISSLFALIAGKVPTFMLAFLQSDYEVGIYNAACRFFDLTAMLAVIVISPFIPIFSAKAMTDLNAVKSISTMLVELIGILLIPFAIAAPMISPALIKAFFGDTYLLSAEVLNILAWAGVLVFYSLLTSAIVLSIGVVHFGYWNTAIVAAVSLFLNYIWIPRYSFVGAAYAMVVCETLLSGVTVFFVIRYVGNVFNGFHWLKIAFANLVFYGLLHHQLFEVNAPARAISSLSIYVILIFLLKAVPKKTLGIIREAFSKRRCQSKDDEYIQTS